MADVDPRLRGVLCHSPGEQDDNSGRWLTHAEAVGRCPACGWLYNWRRMEYWADEDMVLVDTCRPVDYEPGV